jgi:hypothetical protein
VAMAMRMPWRTGSSWRGLLVGSATLAAPGCGAVRERTKIP